MGLLESVDRFVVGGRACILFNEFEEVYGELFLFIVRNGSFVWVYYRHVDGGKGPHALILAGDSNYCSVFDTNYCYVFFFKTFFWVYIFFEFFSEVG